MSWVRLVANRDEWWWMEKEIQSNKCISSLNITAGMGNTTTVIWQMGSTSTQQHHNFPKKVQGGLGMDIPIYCLVFQLLSHTYWMCLFSYGSWIGFGPLTPRRGNLTHTVVLNWCNKTKYQFTAVLGVEQHGLLNLLLPTGTAASMGWHWM